MRISDWSSDVCSSDLAARQRPIFAHPSPRRKGRYLCWVQHGRLKIWNVAPSAHKTCHPSNGGRFPDHTNCPHPAIEMPKKGGGMNEPVKIGKEPGREGVSQY